MHICAYAYSVCRDQKNPLSVLNWSYRWLWIHHVCTEHQTSPLEEQLRLLTSESPFQSFSVFIFKFLSF